MKNILFILICVGFASANAASVTYVTTHYSVQATGHVGSSSCGSDGDSGAIPSVGVIAAAAQTDCGAGDSSAAINVSALTPDGFAIVSDRFAENFSHSGSAVNIRGISNVGITIDVAEDTTVDFTWDTSNEIVGESVQSTTVAKLCVLPLTCSPANDLFAGLFTVGTIAGGSGAFSVLMPPGEYFFRWETSSAANGTIPAALSQIESRSTMSFSMTSAVSDADGDSVPDTDDNCTLVANGPNDTATAGPSQNDTNGDGYGNMCDADLNNDLVINGLDVGLFVTQFGTSGPDADLNGDGVVNGLDTGLFVSMFGQAPGPSGLAP